MIRIHIDLRLRDYGEKKPLLITKLKSCVSLAETDFPVENQYCRVNKCQTKRKKISHQRMLIELNRNKSTGMIFTNARFVHFSKRQFENVIKWQTVRLLLCAIVVFRLGQVNLPYNSGGSSSRWLCHESHKYPAVFYVHI